MTTKPTRLRSSSTGLKRLSPAKASTNSTASAQKPPSSAGNRNLGKPNGRKAPWNGSPSRKSRAEPPPPPARRYRRQPTTRVLSITATRQLVHERQGGSG